MITSGNSRSANSVTLAMIREAINQARETLTRHETPWGWVEVDEMGRPVNLGLNGDCSEAMKALRAQTWGNTTGGFISKFDGVPVYMSAELAANLKENHDAERDYEDMRRFQAQFIEADQRLKFIEREFKKAILWHRENSNPQRIFENETCPSDYAMLALGTPENIGKAKTAAMQHAVNLSMERQSQLDLLKRMAKQLGFEVDP